MFTESAARTLPNQSNTSCTEYTLVALPNKALKDKIVEVKQQLSIRYLSGNFYAPPYITIAKFFAKEEMEETIARYMRRICLLQKSFEVVVNNYGGFPPNAIHLRVQNPQPFTNLTNALHSINNYVQSCSCPPIKFEQRPCISIAHNVPEATYLPLLMEYSQKSFYDSCMIEELALIQHKPQAEKCINVFGLQPAGWSVAN